MDKVIAAYEKENPGVDIVATYDSSGTLQTQGKHSRTIYLQIDTSSTERN